MGLVRLTDRYEARETLRAIDGPVYAISTLSEEGEGDRTLLRNFLQRVASGPGAPLYALRQTKPRGLKP